MPGIGCNSSGGGRGVNYPALAATLAALGLVADFRADSLSLSDGAAVSSWASSVGAYTGTQSGSNRPTYSATGWSDGTPCVTFARASAQCLVCDALASVGSLGGAFTIVAQVRMSSIASDAMLFGLSNGATTYRYLAIDSTNVGTPQIVCSSSTPNALPQAGQGSFTASVAGAITTEDVVVVVTCNGSQSSIYLNGQLVFGSVGTQDAALTYSKAVIGGLNYNGGVHPSAFNGSIKRFIVYNRGFTQKDVAAVIYNLGLQSYLRHSINVLGDSIPLGNVYGPSWPNLLTLTSQAVTLNTVSGAVASRSAFRQGASAGRALVTSALAGTNNEAQNALVDAQANYMPCLPAVIFLSMATNDPYYAGGTLTGVQLFTRYAGVVAQLRAAAPRAFIVAFTVLPRANWSTAANYGGSDAPYDLALADFNVLMRPGYKTIGCDDLVDFAAIPQMADPTNATIYGDLCHPTTFAHATYLAPAVQARLAAMRLGAADKVLQAMMAGT